MSFIYIASPYTDPDPRVREKRYLQVSYYVVALLARHKFPYSPIVSNHHLALEFDLTHTALDWMAYNFAMLSSASELHVLQLPGWEKSTGVLAEMNFWRAARQGLPIQMVKMPTQSEIRAIERGKLECRAPAQRGG